MPFESDVEERISARLAALKSEGLERHPRPPCGIDLSSNDYLGLAAHPLLRERMAAAVMKEGCGATGSRLLRGERECFQEIENKFARFKGARSALYFGSGYAANLGVLTAFLEPGDVVFSDALNHASLIDGLRLARARRVVFPHRDVDALAGLLKSETAPGQKFLVTESLFGMDGHFAPLAEYAGLCRETGTALIVDEAHAVGIYGAGGSGLIEAAAIRDQVFISVNTAGKALGVSGAFVAGPEFATHYLVQKARTFIFSTAPIPAVAAGLDAALDLIAAEPERRRLVLARAGYLRQQLAGHGLAISSGSSQIIPIMIGDNRRAVTIAEKLQSDGFDVRAIRPPTVPAGTARLRVSVNVNLDEATLASFASALARAMAGSATGPA